MLLSTVGVGNALVESVKRGDRRALQSLLEKYPAALSSSINHRQMGWTALSLSIYTGQQPMMKLAMQFGADLHLEQSGDLSPLVMASMRGSKAEVDALIDAEVDLEQTFTSRMGFTALMAACYAGHAEIVSTLLEHGANAHALGENGRTPAFYAALAQQPKCLDLVLTHAFSAHETQRSSSEAGNPSARTKQIPAIDTVRDVRGQTLLQAVVVHTDAVRILQMLLQTYDANIFVTDQDGYELLVQAVLYRSKKCVKLLLDTALERLEKDLQALKSLWVTDAHLLHKNCHQQAKERRRGRRGVEVVDDEDQEEGGHRLFLLHAVRHPRVLPPQPLPQQSWTAPHRVNRGQELSGANLWSCALYRGDEELSRLVRQALSREDVLLRQHHYPYRYHLTDDEDDVDGVDGKDDDEADQNGAQNGDEGDCIWSIWSDPVGHECTIA